MHSKIKNLIIFRYVFLGCLLCVIVITLLLELTGVYIEMSPLEPPPIKNTGDIALTLQPLSGHNHDYIGGKF